MATPLDRDLFPELRNPPDTRVINARCLLRAQDGHRVVIVSGIVLAHYALGDRVAEEGGRSCHPEQRLNDLRCKCVEPECWRLLAPALSQLRRKEGAPGRQY